MSLNIFNIEEKRYLMNVQIRTPFNSKSKKLIQNVTKLLFPECYRNIIFINSEESCCCNSKKGLLSTKILFDTCMKENKKQIQV